jgi:uncharacterized protein YyaL (SSP411 family)
MSAHSDRPANRLSFETSPYLLQHQYNPVDWYPWGSAAIERARAEQKPVFLSIGYSACHWCHVMERESFEDPQIARLMNEHFINIKVDREERPDLDQIYMNAVQAMTGHGGWPMSVFLTPDLMPFFGGTYFPPSDRRGMPGFGRVLLSVARAWAERREDIIQSAAQLTSELERTTAALVSSTPAAGAQPMGQAILDHAFERLERSFDRRHGGFGDAPKFPHPMDLRLLMRYHARTGNLRAREMVALTLDRMARGGIYDHLGGGFARYSTDAFWLVPHFEKMLYDNALLASTYLEAFQLTRNADFAIVAQQVLDYLIDRMTAPEGGIYSTEDADSEGVEGKFYVWTLDQIHAVLGPERGNRFCQIYGVTAEGNWEHGNILHLPRPLADVARDLGIELGRLECELAEDRRALRIERVRRIPPGKDTKILAAWNGLAIAALAEAAWILGEPRFLEAATAAAEFILAHMRQPDGRLWHAWAQGRPRFNAYLDDYACLIDGLTRLFEASGEARWLEAALDLTGIMIREFHDPAGGFFYTGIQHESLIVRVKDITDNATPSASAMATTALLRLAALTDRTDLQELAIGTLHSVRPLLEKAPAAAGQFLIALDFSLDPPRQFVVVAGADAGEFATALSRIAARFLPGKIVAPRPRSTEPVAPALRGMWADRPSRDGQVTIYECRDFTCRQPYVGLDALTAGLDSAPV